MLSFFPSIFFGAVLAAMMRCGEFVSITDVLGRSIPADVHRQRKVKSLTSR
jgi:hypothetical protein